MREQRRTNLLLLLALVLALVVPRSIVVPLALASFGSFLLAK